MTEPADLAREAAALADPLLDPWFSSGHPDWRRSVVTAMAGLLDAGEDTGTVALEYGVSAEAVAAVQAWMARWPGAWL